MLKKTLYKQLPIAWLSFKKKFLYHVACTATSRSLYISRAVKQIFMYVRSMSPSLIRDHGPWQFKSKTHDLFSAVLPLVPDWGPNSAKHWECTKNSILSLFSKALKLALCIHPFRVPKLWMFPTQVPKMLTSPHYHLRCCSGSQGNQNSSNEQLKSNFSSH